MPLTNTHLLLARAIKLEYNSWTDLSPEHEQSRTAIRILTDSICQTLKDRSDNFDQNEFLEACGFMISVPQKKKRKK